MAWPVKRNTTTPFATRVQKPFCVLHVDGFRMPLLGRNSRCTCRVYMFMHSCTQMYKHVRKSVRMPIYLQLQQQQQQRQQQQQQQRQQRQRQQPTTTTNSFLV